MPDPIDLLKGRDRTSLVLEVAYGRHIGGGDPTMAYVTGTDPTHVLQIRNAFCEGPIDEVEGIWYDGQGIESSEYTLYDGTQTTAPAAPFDLDQPHWRTAMVNVELPSGLGPSAPSSEDLPDQLAILFKGLKVEDYDADGTPDGTPTYSVNPARVVADLLVRGNEPLTRVNFERWAAWRDFFETTESQDYTSIPNAEGIGLTASIYNGTNFNTFVLKRIDQTVDADLGEGAPAFGVTTNNFSIRWEGYIKSKGAGSYNFAIDHDDGVRLYVDSLVTPIIDQFVDGPGDHNANITLAANTFYPIRIDFYDLTSVSRCILTWTPPSETEQVVPRQYLFPKTETAKVYELHALYETPQTPDEAVRHALLLSNSFQQEADGKRNFYCFDEITETSFDFDASNIREDTFEFYRRDRRDTANRMTALFRDLNAQYLQVAEPPVVKEYPELQDETGVLVNYPTVDLDNTTHWQARKVLDRIGKREIEMDLLCEFDGLASTYQVLPGDVVTVTWEPAGWTGKVFLCLEAVDYSPETTPDRRRFTLLEWEL